MDFVESLLRQRPRWSNETYVILTAVAIVGFLICWWWVTKKGWDRRRMVFSYMLSVYLLLVFSSTVFTRVPTEEMQYELEFLWSYRWGIDEFGQEMVREIILNVLMLMPVGLFLPEVIRFRHPIRTVVAVGFGVSFMIEFLQLVTRRGLFEFDDMLHNTVGVWIGCVVWCWGVKRLGKIRE